MSAGDIRAGRAFVELFMKNNLFLRGLRDAKRQLDQFGKDMQALGVRMAGVGIGVGVPLFSATKRFADFDDAMRAVGAVSRSTDEELARMTEVAKRLGATTSFTAVQVASLMTELGRAGFSADQVNDMTGAVLNLSRATGTDATLASGIMAASIRQFGLAATDASRVADALTTAANMSFNTVEQLGEALSYAGPVAADFNMSLEDTLAIFGGLGNVGIQASNAGTAVRRLLTMTAADAAKMQKIFGVSFKDAAGNARPLVDVLEEVNAATASLGTAERAAKFNEAFGLLGITAASAIGKSVGSIRELRAALVGAAGAADATAKKMDAGLGGSFRILLSAVEGVAIGIGEALAPAVKDVADTMTGAAGIALDYVRRHQDVAVTVAKVATAAVLAGGGLIGLGLTFQFGATAIGGFLAPLTLASAVLGTLLSPMGLLTGAAVAAAVKFRDFRVSLGPLPGLLRSLRDDVSSAWAGIAEAIKTGDWETAAAIAAAGLRLAVVRTMSAATNNVTGLWGDAMDDIVARIALGDVGGAWKTMVDGLGAMWAELIQRVKTEWAAVKEWAALIGGGARRMVAPTHDEKLAKANAEIRTRERILAAKERMKERGEASALDVANSRNRLAEAKRQRDLIVAEMGERRRRESLPQTAETDTDRAKREQLAKNRATREAANARNAERRAKDKEAADLAALEAESAEMKAFRDRVKARAGSAEDIIRVLEDELATLRRSVGPAVAAPGGDAAEGPMSEWSPSGRTEGADEGTGEGTRSGSAAAATTSIAGTFSAAALAALGRAGGDVPKRTYDEIKTLRREAREDAKEHLRELRKLADAVRAAAPVFA